MDIRAKRIALVAFVYAAPAALHAQFDFKLAGRPVQVHSFASQGFAYSNQNNYLTMKTSQGSFSMTDFGFNASMLVADKFRVGAQLYSYNVGALGRYRPQLDWAVADYRFLARLAAVFSVLAFPVVSDPSGASRWARTNQWNSSSWRDCPMSMS